MKANPVQVSKQPIKVKRGNITVKIYEGTNRFQGNSYTQYTVVHYLGIQRVKRKFSSLEEARREAEFIVTKLAGGDNDALRLTSTERIVYLHAQEELRPLNRPLNIAVSEYVNAVKRLPPGLPLNEVVDFYLRRVPKDRPRKMVREVVSEFIEIKTKAGRGAVHLKDLQSRLGRFAEAFQTEIGNVTGSMVEKHLDSLDVAGRTKRNHFCLIRSLLKFAIRRKYVPSDALDELAQIEKPEAELNEIEIFTPAEMHEMLAVAREEIVPCLAIAGFAGLRSAELQRLDWGDVNLAERYIEVTAAKSKTASRRLVPITDNLLAWLAPRANANGRVSKYDNMAKQIGWLVDDINVKRRQQAEASGSTPAIPFAWKRNALRHSFISYRLAAIKNTAEVALEAGNSPQMIFRHYRQLVTEAQAKKWFAILPENHERQPAQLPPTL